MSERASIESKVFAFFLVALALQVGLGTGFAQSAPIATPPILLGTAWYPEQWPEARWDAGKYFANIFEYAG